MMPVVGKADEFGEVCPSQSKAETWRQQHLRLSPVYIISGCSNILVHLKHRKGRANHVRHVCAVHRSARIGCRGSTAVTRPEPATLPLLEILFVWSGRNGTEERDC